MTAHVITSSGDTIGKGGRKLAFSGTAKPCLMRHYELDLGTDVYVANGVDISDIWDDFGTVLHVSVEQKDTSTEANHRLFNVDYSAQKLVVYTDVATESTGVDQGVVTVSLMAFGY